MTGSSAAEEERERLANSSTSVGCSTSQTVGDEDEGITGKDRHTLCSTVTPSMSRSRKFVSLGLFIIDEFAFADAAGKPNGLSLSPQESVFSSPVHPRLICRPTYRSVAEALMLPSALACGKSFLFLAPVG